MQQCFFHQHISNETLCVWIDLKIFMTSKDLLGNSDVEFWTDWTVKLVDMVCISITIYLCQERCMWCNMFQKVYILILPLHKCIPY